ncbi:hypothetical protein SKAU_G00105440 [Synaphobranchus kaupii]|uniref:Uncharacterized protein n=1 Tax=Synaphobranchus kaupii TaxID=118154 RepID=A0A9Q1J7U6_SYNKA|nr:hypothetical protein SKAU_G00105440 [Synaphobranchus kaupii]
MASSEKDHITIQRGRSLPPLAKCTSCCRSYHCPFCGPSVFRPTKPNRVQRHLDSHFSRAVIHQEYIIHRCGLDCRPFLHYHCLYCQATIITKINFEIHLLSSCKSRPTTQLRTRLCPPLNQVCHLRTRLCPPLNQVCHLRNQLCPPLNQVCHLRNQLCPPLNQVCHLRNQLCPPLNRLCLWLQKHPEVRPKGSQSLKKSVQFVNFP